MKLRRIPLCFLMGMVGLMPLRTGATCIESNSDPNYIKKVVMRSSIVCGGYYSTTFTCEHYLNYGQAMAYYDHQVGPDCYYTYTLESCTWIPAIVDQSAEPVYLLHSSFAGSMRGTYGLNLPASTTNKSRSEMVDILRVKLGWPTLGVDNNSKAILDAGPIGLPVLAMVRRYFNPLGQKISWRGGAFNRPEETTSDVANAAVGFLEGYPTLQAALQHGCGSGTRSVIFCKIGAWSSGSAPNPGGNGQIPLNSVTDPTPGQQDAKYWTLIDGEWYTFSHGVDALPGTAQVGTIIHVGEPQLAPGEAIIYFKRCVPNHDWQY